MRIDDKKPKVVTQEDNEAKAPLPKDAALVTKTQAAALAQPVAPTDRLETLPLPTTETIATTTSPINARPLAADNAQEVKARLTALLDTLNAPPTGEIGKAMAVSWAVPESYVALGELLSPEFVTSAFASDLPQDPGLADRSKNRTQALRQLLSGGELRAAKSFVDQAPAPLPQVINSMTLVLQPVYAEVVRAARNASNPKAKVGEIILPSPALIQMEQSLGLLGGEPDIEMLIAIVMQQCTHEADADLRDLMKSMEAQRKHRADLRAQKQTLTDIKGSLQARQERLHGALEQAYNERTRLPPSDPRYINRDEVSLEAFIRDQPVRVMEGALNNFPFDASLAVSTNITRYSYAGTPASGTATANPAKSATANLRMLSSATGATVIPELTTEQRGLQDTYKLSETDMRALVAMHAADPRGMSLERFLVAEVGLRAEQTATFGQTPKSPLVWNANAVQLYMVGRATYAKTFPSPAADLAFGYPEAFRKPPEAVALTGDMRIAQMRYGLSERDTRALDALWKATPGADGNFDRYLSSQGFNYRDEEGRNANAAHLKVIMQVVANPPKGPSIFTKEQAEAFFAQNSVPPWQSMFESTCDNFWLKQMPADDQKRAQDLLHLILSGDAENGSVPSREELNNRFKALPGQWGDVARLWITMRIQFDHQTREAAGNKRGSQLQPVFNYVVEDFPMRSTTWPPAVGPSQAAMSVANRYLQGDNFGAGAPIGGTPPAQPANNPPAPRGGNTGSTPPVSSGGNTSQTPPAAPPKPPADARTGSPAAFDKDDAPFSDLSSAIRSLDSKIDTLQTDMDSANELNDVNQLRLQRYMERRQSFFSTLSNALKKMGETSAQIAQNLK